MSRRQRRGSRVDHCPLQCHCAFLKREARHRCSRIQAHCGGSAEEMIPRRERTGGVPNDRVKKRIPVAKRRNSIFCEGRARTARTRPRSGRSGDYALTMGKEISLRCALSSTLTTRPTAKTGSTTAAALGAKPPAFCLVGCSFFCASQLGAFSNTTRLSTRRLEAVPGRRLATTTPLKNAATAPIHSSSPNSSVAPQCSNPVTRALEGVGCSLPPFLSRPPPTCLGSGEKGGAESKSQIDSPERMVLLECSVRLLVANVVPEFGERVCSRTNELCVAM